MPTKKIKQLLNKRYPQNFLIHKPVVGVMIFFVFIYGFVIVYQPHQVHQARSFSFDYTMLLYSLIISFAVFAFLRLLKGLPFWKDSESWTFLKELLFDVIILAAIGVSAYFAGFVIEEPVSRWDLPTFFDSFHKALLLGLVPILFFTALNMRFLFIPEITHDFKPGNNFPSGSEAEKQIDIISQAKKEQLGFYPQQFIYAESQGNYVVFHLVIEDQSREVMIRSSINNIEQQLSAYPSFMRVHRSFIVNLKKVTTKSGNSLGYRLKLAGSNNIIPVSRKNTRKLDKELEK